jgi:hypothetical protein
MEWLFIGSGLRRKTGAGKVRLDLSTCWRIIGRQSGGGDGLEIEKCEICDILWSLSGLVGHMCLMGL